VAVRAVLFGVLVAAAACSSSDMVSTLDPCGPSGACATGYTCDSSDLKCHRSSGQTGPVANLHIDIVDYGINEAPITVGFVGADGSSATAMVDTVGNASLILPAVGGSVTVARAGDLFTFVGVRPDTELHVGVELVAGDAIWSLSVTPPAQPADTSPYYTLDDGCLADAVESFGAPARFLTGPPCLGTSGKLFFLAHVSDTSSTLYSGVRDIDPAATQITLPPFVPARAAMLDLINGPVRGFDHHLVIGYLIDGARAAASTADLPGPGPFQPEPIEIPPAQWVDRYALRDYAIDQNSPSGVELVSSFFLDGGAAVDPVTVDLDHLPPGITAFTRDGATGAVSWSTERPFPEAVAVRVQLEWTDATGLRTWTILAPPTSPLAPPQLPATLAGEAPATGAAVTVRQLDLIEQPAPGGYVDWLRAHHGQVVDLGLLDNRPDALGSRVSTATRF
jgi:hypothetical protein